MANNMIVLSPLLLVLLFVAFAGCTMTTTNAT